MDDDRRRRRGRPALYPWDEWFSGENRTLLRSVDFAEDVRIDNLRRYILAEARRRGVDVVTSVMDEDTLVLSFHLRRATPVELLTHDEWTKIFFPRQFGHSAITLDATRLGKAPIATWIDAIERKAPPTLAYRLIYDRFAHELTVEPLEGEKYMDFDVEAR